MEQSVGSTNRTIVSIEDDPSTIDLFRFILEMEGYEVLGATNGAAGLELIEFAKPDLVLLDILMPKMSGWEVYQRMRASETMRGIPVIVVTCLAEPIDRILATNIAKVNDFIPKPFNPRTLVESIDRILGISEKAPQL